MKFYLTILVLVFTVIQTYSQSKIKYFSEPAKDDFHSLRALYNNEEYTLIDGNSEICWWDLKFADYNENGCIDILVEIRNGCGGNCCGNSYQIFSFNGEEFIGTERIGWDWDGIDVSESLNGYKFIIDTVAGNNQNCENKVETFRLKDYEWEVINTDKQTKLQALAEIETTDYDNLSVQDFDKMFLSFDLNGDAFDDKITFSYYERWNTIRAFKVKFNNGKTFSKDDLTGVKRIGVLNTKTNGVHDLIVGCETIMKWNGSSYE